MYIIDTILNLLILYPLQNGVGLEEKFYPQIFTKRWQRQFGFINKSFNEDLCVAFVKDIPGDYSFAEEVKGSLTLEDFASECMTNLESTLQHPELIREKLKGGTLITWRAKDRFSAVRILLPQYYNQLTKELGDTFYFAMASPDIIICWDSEDPEDIKKIKEQAQEDYDTELYNLSPAFYRWNEVHF